MKIKTKHKESGEPRLTAFSLTPQKARLCSKTSAVTGAAALFFVKRKPPARLVVMAHLTKMTFPQI